MSENRFFNEIYNRFHKKIFSVVCNYFTDRDEQKDAFQEVLIHISQKLTNLPDDEFAKWNSASWLHTTTKNLCISILRKNKKEFVRFDNDSLFENKIEQSPYKDNPFLENSKSVKKINISDLLNQLKKEDRYLILLRFFKGYSIKEIDQETGITNAAVSISRILVKLKKIMSVDDFYNYFDSYQIED